MSKSISTMKNASMNNAKKAKKDDFYTPLDEIEAELSNYKEYFKDKVICLPCDESEHTNFFKHFMLNVDEYKWKKLIAIGYRTNRNAQAHVVVVENGNEDEQNYTLIGNGDFRNQDTLEYMKEADIIVTNPPFSVYREFMATLIELDKKFIIIGNQNSVNCKEIFPLFQDNKVWFGYGYNKVMEFNVRGDDYTYDRVDSEGKRYGKVPGICWMTNLPTKKREQILDTEIDYEYGMRKGWYQQCQNYKAINVNKVNQIPMDYEGVMAVPITFMNQHNPNQYNILGITSSSKELTGGLMTDESLSTRVMVDGKYIYSRVLIQKKKQEN